MVASDDISVFILLRQPAFDSVWHFRKSVRNSFVKVWQIEKFHFETEQEENFLFLFTFSKCRKQKKMSGRLSLNHFYEELMLSLRI